jgi:hypothetical protein
MYHTIRIEKEQETKGLSKDVFTFILMDNMEIILNGYEILQRDTTTHRFKTVAEYHRLSGRSSSMSKDYAISKVLSYGEIIDDVIKEISSQIKFITDK